MPFNWHVVSKCKYMTGWFKHFLTSVTFGQLTFFWKHLSVNCCCSIYFLLNISQYCVSVLIDFWNMGQLTFPWTLLNSCQFLVNWFLQHLMFDWLIITSNINTCQMFTVYFKIWICFFYTILFGFCTPHTPTEFKLISDPPTHRIQFFFRAPTHRIELWPRGPTYRILIEVRSAPPPIRFFLE